MSEVVRALYEAYPYPDRSAQDDKVFVTRSSPLEDLRMVSLTACGGTRTPADFKRILIAGGGTGDGLVLLAHQVRESGGEVVYIDLSEAARAVAERRCQDLGLDDVVFHTGSLLDPPADLGTFDYINCSGVLHHLPDPEAGIRSLSSLLNPDGVLGVMVYGAIGRTGVYEVQAALRALVGDASLPEQVEAARRMLRQLPDSNWLSINPLCGYTEQIDDAELADRYLHPCDQAYTVAGCVELAGSAGLEIVDFTPPVIYDAAMHLADPEIRRRVAALSRFERYGFAERLSGLVICHSFFATATPAPAEPVPGEHVVPHVLGRSPVAVADEIAEAQALGIRVRGLTYSASFVPDLGVDMALRAIDGSSTLAELHAALPELARRLSPWPVFLQRFTDVYTFLRSTGTMALSVRQGASESTGS